MQLLLFRHGIAEPADAAIPDAERRLTPRGIQRTTLAAQGLARIADRPDAILTSPKLRAAQSAAILGEAFDLQPQTCDVLALGPAEAVQQMLRGRMEDRLLLVGHEPTLSQLIHRLCMPDLPGRLSFVAMKKAGCALVEAPLRRNETQGTALLHWLLPPHVLRELAHAQE